jgi:hypothetical protein
MGLMGVFVVELRGRKKLITGFEDVSSSVFVI